MSAAPTNIYDATASMLGYLYQCRCALLLLLQRSKDDPEALLSIERFDDVAFELAGEPLQRIQTKHHLTAQRNLSNASPDLWKTIRIWCEGVQDGTLGPPVVLTLLTTCTAPDGSAASHLRPTERDEIAALAILRETAATSSSRENNDCYTVFESLDGSQQVALIRMIQVLDRAPSILALADHLRDELHWCVRSVFIDRLLERLEGWWCNLVIEHLTGIGSAPISGYLLRGVMDDLREQFQADNLTIDYRTESPPDRFVIDADTRLFLQQLEWIRVRGRRVETAMRDFYRASKQRTRWLREDPTIALELIDYDSRLEDEWRRHFDREAEEAGDEPCEDHCISCGRNVYDRTQDLSIHVRPRCTEPYVMRGSYHLLADRARIGWHLSYEARIRALAEERAAND